MSTLGNFGSDSGGRMKGVKIVKPIVYGNIARHLWQKREEDGHTHQWTVFVKPYENEDMSSYVKKVHFKLHESYPDANRVVTKPPYEITETGWGEFEIMIKIYFVDPNERPSVTVYHLLKLYELGPGRDSVTKAVVSESYEELVFQDPTKYMHFLLTNTKPASSGEWKHETDFEEKKSKTLEAIQAAKEKNSLEIQEMKMKLRMAKETIKQFKAEIDKLKTPQPDALT